MKSILKYIGIFACALTLNSCESYLDRQPDDALTLEMVFSKKATTQQYLMNVYSYMINETKIAHNAPWLGASDEASISYSGNDRGYNFMNNGSWSASTPPYGSYWKSYYQGIREATFFMKNVDRCPELNFEEKIKWKAEARFMRAYYYAMLMRLYGPVIIVGKDVIDIETTEMDKERSTWEECIDYICNEFDEVSEILPIQQDPYWYGKPTKGAALGIKARMLLYSARELYNSDNSFYKNIISTEGKPLFPQSRNDDKWRIAAEANKAVIDIGVYNLYKEYNTAGSIDPCKSYAGIFLQLWNEEIIFGYAVSAGEWRFVTTPRVIGGNAFGGVGPTQKMVDAYAMADGHYPIIGYTDNGQTPIIDNPANSATKYEEGKFATVKNLADGISYANTNTMYNNREPRFYVSVFWSGMKAFDKAATTANFYKGGNSGFGDATDNYPKTGYLICKMSDRTLNLKDKQYGRFSWPLVRLGEIYLNYAEALNEYDPENPDILTYVNLIRERAGVKKLEEVYPNDVTDQAKMRELIRRERQVELAFEGYRYFDTRTWAIAEQTENGPMYGMNIMATTDAASSDFWQRTVFESRIFNKKHYLFPISQEELDRNKKITQNYLW